MRNEIGIAPGLSVSVDVEFLTRVAGDFSDRLVVLAEDFRAEVELVAQTPRATARKGEGAVASRPAEVTEKARTPGGTVDRGQADRRKELSEEPSPVPKQDPAVIPLIKVNPDMLHFGECPVNHRCGSRQFTESHGLGHTVRFIVIA